MEPLLVLRVAFQKRLRPPSGDVERRAVTKEDRWEGRVGGWPWKYPSKERGKQEERAGRCWARVLWAGPRVRPPRLRRPPFPGKSWLGQAAGAGAECPGREAAQWWRAVPGLGPGVPGLQLGPRAAPCKAAPCGGDTHCCPSCSSLAALAASSACAAPSCIQPVCCAWRPQPLEGQRRRCVLEHQSQTEDKATAR